MSQMTWIFIINQRFDWYQTFDLHFGLRGRWKSNFVLSILSHLIWLQLVSRAKIRFYNIFANYLEAPRGLRGHSLSHMGLSSMPFWSKYTDPPTFMICGINFFKMLSSCSKKVNWVQFKVLQKSELLNWTELFSSVQSLPCKFYLALSSTYLQQVYWSMQKHFLGQWLLLEEQGDCNLRKKKFKYRF